LNRETPQNARPDASATARSNGEAGPLTRRDIERLRSAQGPNGPGVAGDVAGNGHGASGVSADAGNGHGLSAGHGNGLSAGHGNGNAHGNGHGNGVGAFVRTADSMLETASRLCERLAPLNDQAEIAQAAVSELYDDFDLLIAAILRIDRDAQKLQLVAATGKLVEERLRAGVPVRWEQSLSEGVNGRVARTGRAALVGDADDDPDFIFVPSALRARSAVAVPIRVEGRVWGVLDLESAEPHAFGRVDLLLAETVASRPCTTRSSSSASSAR